MSRAYSSKREELLRPSVSPKARAGGDFASRRQARASRILSTKPHATLSETNEILPSLTRGANKAKSPSPLERASKRSLKKRGSVGYMRALRASKHHVVSAAVTSSSAITSSVPLDLDERQDAESTADDFVERTSARVKRGVSTGGRHARQHVADSVVKLWKRRRTKARQRRAVRRFATRNAARAAKGTKVAVRTATNAFRRSVQIVTIAVKAIISAVAAAVSTVITSPIAFLATAGLIVLVCIFVPTCSAFTSILNQGSTQGSGQAQAFARIVHQEYEGGMANDGEKYQNEMGIHGDWCLIFVSWCAKKAGLMEAGIFPSNTYNVQVLLQWYRDHPDAGTINDSWSYDPKVGDLVLYDNAGSNPGPNHIGVIVQVGQNEAGRKFWVADHGNPRQEKTVTADATGSYEADANAHSAGGYQHIWYITPKWKGGSNAGTIQIPEPYGAGGYSITPYDSFYPIWARSSRQRVVADMWANAGMSWNDHIAVLNGRYLIACTTTFGQVGDMVDFYLDDGTVIPAIIADAKNPNDPGCNEWGHSNGQNVLEFEVENAHYRANGNPGTSAWKSEWKGRRVTSATNIGSIL